jgi:hypothetical protein
MVLLAEDAQGDQTRYLERTVAGSIRIAARLIA